MREFLEPVFALAWKDWLRFSRQPFLIVVSIVMPLAFILFYAIIVPSSSTNPVVVALESDSPAAQQFLHTLRKIQSQEAPYYEIITTDPTQAHSLFDAGQAFGLIVIPADFETRLASGSAQVELHINNINSDYSKNLRLRLDYAVRQFSDQLNGPAIRIDETTWLPRDPVMQDYISTSLLLFACLYGAMVNTGLQVASEWNDRTVKTLLLAPVGRSTLVAGKMIAGLGQSLFSILLVTLVLVVVFGFRPVGSLWAMTGVVVVVVILGAGLGAMAGIASKQTLPTVSLLIPSAIAIFLLSGSEDSLRGLAWSGPVVVLWQISRVLPTTYAFLAARSLFLTGEMSTLGRDLGIVLALTVAVIAVAALLLRRAYSQLPGGQ
jgi:ABC-2 type transport system permease protein